MPFLIRIIVQRVFLAVIAILGFFGINPDIAAPSLVEVQENLERQQELVEQVLSPSNTPEIIESTQPSIPPADSPKKNTTQEIEEKITDIQREFTQTITQSVSQKAQEIIPESSITGVTSELASQDASTGSIFAVKDVVVNIVCLEKTRAYTRMSSGSGVIVSNNGLVLTNAHVTYPFLKTKQFSDDTYTCSVRRDGFANFGYNAELVYYPIDWLEYNSEIIKEASPIGTGENDYALLLITTPVGLGPKINSYPAASLNVNTSDLEEKIKITVAGYPSSSSGVFEVDSNPGLKIADSYIEEFFTFSGRSFDVLQTGPNLVAKRGSSGGGVFKSNLLYGLVVTTNDDGNGSYLNALTLPYIKRDFENDTGMSLDKFITTPLDVLKLRFSVSYRDRLKAVISEN